MRNPFGDRRRFLERIVQFFSAGIAALLLTPLFRFVNGPQDSEAAEGWREIAVLSDLPVGEVTQVAFKKLVRDGWMSSMTSTAVFVSRAEDGACLVLDPHCTHLGCEVAWSVKNKQFACPCHGGKYNAAGNRTSGPPPRPLRRYETRIANGVLSIGKLKG